MAISNELQTAIIQRLEAWKYNAEHNKGSVVENPRSHHYHVGYADAIKDALDLLRPHIVD